MDYTPACERVKIGEFVRRYNVDITGVIHVGVNYGYELVWYERMGIKNILGFDPIKEQIEQARLLCPNALLFVCALGNCNDTLPFDRVAGDGQGSSFMELVKPDECRIVLESNRVNVIRFDRIVGIDMHDYNCLVVDVEGMEYQVLMGFGVNLDAIDMINIELAEVPVYQGQTAARDVVDYLARRGFKQITPIDGHNDVLFVREWMPKVNVTNRKSYGIEAHGFVWHVQFPDHLTYAQRCQVARDFYYMPPHNDLMTWNVPVYKPIGGAYAYRAEDPSPMSIDIVHFTKIDRT